MIADSYYKCLVRKKVGSLHYSIITHLNVSSTFENYCEIRIIIGMEIVASIIMKMV